MQKRSQSQHEVARFHEIEEMASNEVIKIPPYTPIVELLQKQNKDYFQSELDQTKTIFQTSFKKHFLLQDPNQQYEQYSNGNIEIKKGPVQIRFNTSGYNKVLICLKRDKLVVMDGKNVQKVINLKQFQYNCEKHNKLQDVITLTFQKMKKIIQIKITNQIEFKLWFQCLKMVEDHYCNSPKFICDEYYFTNDFVREDEFLKIADTGDILLFETDHYLAKVQRTLTNSPFDHVGFIVRDHDLLYVIDAKSDTGVDNLYWSQYIRENDLYKKIGFRKLITKNREQINETLRNFADIVNGQEYEMNFGKLIQFQTNNQLAKSYFCSELVAKAYKTCKLLPDNKASSQYWPVTFSKRLPLLNDAKLSDPIMILLTKNCKRI